MWQIICLLSFRLGLFKVRGGVKKGEWCWQIALGVCSSGIASFLCTRRYLNTRQLTFCSVYTVAFARIFASWGVNCLLHDVPAGEGCQAVPMVVPAHAVHRSQPAHKRWAARSCLHAAAKICVGLSLSHTEQQQQTTTPALHKHTHLLLIAALSLPRCRRHTAILGAHCHWPLTLQALRWQSTVHLSEAAAGMATQLHLACHSTVATAAWAKDQH